jgi:hypothetical protein
MQGLSAYLAAEMVNISGKVGHTPVKYLPRYPSRKDQGVVDWFIVLILSNRIGAKA